ncbi:MAG TPA: anti-sigma factor [Gemmataceae bacterium]|nr:anti-sigma factor [Gemmataceae bacterium]
MTCTAARNLMHAFLDGELDLVRRLEIEHHLQDCNSCAEIHESHLNLRTSFRSDELYHCAPAQLRERVAASFAGPPVAGVQRLRVTRGWIGYAAAAACIAVLSWTAGRVGLGFAQRSERPMEEAVLVGHVRSLQETHLTDVASSDQHVVKPWFTGKLDYSITVPAFDQTGFRLLGGRLDYLDNRAVAALVYERNRHVINLFLWPAQEERETEIEVSSRQGYQFIHWVQGKMQYWAVSDLNGPELQAFAHLVREGPAN